MIRRRVSGRSHKRGRRGSTGFEFQSIGRIRPTQRVSRPAPSSRPFPFGHGPAVDYFLSVLIPRIGIESEAEFVARSVAIASMV
jgi:hypothetical protein